MAIRLRHLGASNIENVIIDLTVLVVLQEKRDTLQVKIMVFP